MGGSVGSRGRGDGCGGRAGGAGVEAYGRVGVRGGRGDHGRDGGLAQDADAPRVRPPARADEGAFMMTGYHPLVKRLLDGELSLAELPPELRAEGEQALRLVGAADRAPVALSPALEERVMAVVRRHAASPAHRAWRWLNTPRAVELRLRVR